jgi:predicted ATPase
MARGVALAGLGQHEEGIAQLHHGFAQWQRIGANLANTKWLGFTAEAHAAAGEIGAAFAALDRAADAAAVTGEAFFQSQLFTVRALLLVKSGLHAEAEAWLHKAIDIARTQSAKSLELRAATALARLWHDQGRHSAARDLLAQVYGWFVEGLDTLDLKEAKALLRELHESAPPSLVTSAI